jgi:ABC-type lipoprotein export system ATPase subunit
MLVGATGSGKSTLVDGFVNYILGVSFEDPFRFTLVNLENDEKKTDDQVLCIVSNMHIGYIHINGPHFDAAKFRGRDLVFFGSQYLF